MNHASGPRRRRAGFSLIELLVSVSVAGTLATIAMPTLGRLVQDSRRAAAANELLSAMILARAEAAAQGRDIVICGLEDMNRDGRLAPAELKCRGTDWSGGWLVAAWEDANHDGTVDAAELAAPLRVFVNGEPGLAIRAPGFGNSPQPAGTAVLRPFDRFSTNGTVTLCDRRGAEEARALVLSPNGRARITSRAASGAPLSCA